MIKTDAKTTVDQIITVRGRVAFLGEKAQFGWWPTSFYEMSSRGFLEPVFAKTWRQARYQGAVEAARRLHDERLSVGCFHLFRLPEEVEQNLQAALRRSADALDDPAILGGKQSALDALAALGSKEPKAQIGPVQVGSIAAINEGPTLEKIAGIYAATIAAGHQAFPYLAA